MAAVQIVNMSDTDKLGEALSRSLSKLGPEAREEVEKLLEPEVLAIVAGVLVVWIASHFIGIGEIVDIILLVVGVFAIGMAVFDGVEHLYDFASIALNAQSEKDLDKAAEHFAEAVAILGIQAVLAVLFRGAPKTFKGGRIKAGPAPKFTKGAKSKPPLKSTRSEPAGSGYTTAWGEIVISRLGSKADRRLVALHENVHRILTPKLKILRRFRISNRSSSYSRSPLSRYLEEALAEVVAQVGVNGFKSVFKGIAFPVQNGYVTILRPVVRAGERISPFLPELGGLVSGGFIVGGQTYKIIFSRQKPTDDKFQLPQSSTQKRAH